MNDKIMNNNYFPYKFREGQKDFLNFILSNIENGGVCLNAATGFGKTPAILAALLPHAMDHPIIWAVRTGNETDRPIEELKIINEKKGSEFFGLSYRGKRDMCLLARDLEKEMDYNDVSFLCKSTKECEYDFDYIDVEEFLKEPMLYSEILKICKDKKICPYKVQRYLLPYADVVSLNYNYIIHDGMSWAIRREVPFEQSYLVVDEAHNLQYACMNLNSDRITSGTISNAIKEIKKFDAKDIEGFISAMKEEMMKIHKEMDSNEKEFDVTNFMKIFRNDDKFNSIHKYGMKIRRKQLKKGKRPRSSLYHLSNFWLNAIENIDIEGIAFIKRKERKKLAIEMWDMRSSVILQEKWKDFKGCIYCSGTLNPIKAFAETIGLEKYNDKSFHFPYQKKKIKSLITRNLSTKGEKLRKEMAENYIEVVKNFIKIMDANVAIFSSSYRIQKSLLKNGLKEIIENEGKEFFLEIEGMSGDRARRVLDNFKNSDGKGVLCATASGRFAEGADFPGKDLEGIFLVGIPFDRMNMKTRLYLDYYEKLYGKKKGNYYAYVVPALRRASQSLGRALRSKEDGAFFVCGDERYQRFFNLLPDFVRETAEIVEPREIPEKIMEWKHI